MTFYERVLIYCKTNQVSPPTWKQRSDLGEEVIKLVKPKGKITSFENGHFIPVNDYPEYANEIIDSILEKHYRNGKR